jgi:glycosyltransferase involved in cell wall biosynthesis
MEEVHMSQTDTPRVSVICTVYNGMAHLDKAVPSILAQTLTDFEFLIVDDGSDDGTSRYLAGVAAEDPRVRVLRLERVGLARAVNYALRFARAPYVARQDFDDISYPERLEKQVEYLDSHPEVGLVGTWYVLDDANRGERYVRQHPTDDYSLRRRMTKAIPFAHTLVMVRTHVLRYVGGIAEVDNITDLRTWIAIAETGRALGNVPEVLGEHFVYADSFWHRTFSYRRRQWELALVQLSAVFRLGLGWWRLIYPLGRLVYGSLSRDLKRFVRRTLAGNREADLVAP